MFVRNAWYVAAMSTEITNELFARTLLNDKIVMYRTSRGAIVALEDRCAHRHVPLSVGCLENDEVSCLYHGMRYDTTGQCVHIPSQEIIPRAARIRAFPVAERHGFVWIWPGDPRRCDESRIPDHSLCESPDLAGELYYTRPQTDYRLGIDNFLDTSHVAFVHPGTVLSEAVTTARAETEVSGDLVRVRRVMRNEKSSPLFQAMMNLDHIDRIQDLLFWPVGNCRTDTIARPPGEVDGPELRTYALGLFTPETENTCHLWSGIWRNFELDSPDISAFVADQLRLIISQDVHVVEHAQRNWRDDQPLVHLNADQGSIAARQILDRLAQDEQAALNGEGIHGELAVPTGGRRLQASDDRGDVLSTLPH